MAVARYQPAPAFTNDPDITPSPGALSTGSLSPVSSDSSISRPRAATTSPSTTTWSPGWSSRISSATTSLVPTSSVCPSRTTRARGADSTASLCSSRRALSSWAMPMTLFDTTTPANRASAGKPATMMSTNIEPMMALTGVSTLLRTIWPTVRTGASGTSLVRPSRRRCSTSAVVSPRGAAATSGMSGVTPARRA